MELCGKIGGGAKLMAAHRPAASRRQQFSDSIPETSDANYTGMSLRERA
jgi:hypothetical protein